MSKLRAKTEREKNHCRYLLMQKYKVPTANRNLDLVFGFRDMLSTYIPPISRFLKLKIHFLINYYSPYLILTPPHPPLTPAGRLIPGNSVENHSPRCHNPSSEGVSVLRSSVKRMSEGTGRPLNLSAHRRATLSLQAKVKGSGSWEIPGFAAKRRGPPQESPSITYGSVFPVAMS